MLFRYDRSRCYGYHHGDDYTGQTDFNACHKLGIGSWREKKVQIPSQPIRIDHSEPDYWIRIHLGDLHSGITVYLATFWHSSRYILDFLLLEIGRAHV